MRCKYCNVEIEGQAVVCPLCHEKLAQDPQSDAQVPTYPPKRLHRHPHTHFTFTNIYLFVSAVLFFIGMTIALVLTPQVQWFWMIALIALHGYLLVRYTILSARSIGMKIFLQACMILILLVAADRIFLPLAEETPTLDWTLEIALPAILGVSTIVMGVLTAVYARRRPSVLMDCILLSSLGFLPLILYATDDLTSPYAAIACAVLSGIAILCCVVFGRKEIAQEFSKRLHI